jgi:hypothetical protein
MSIVKRAVRGTVASALSVLPPGTVLSLIEANSLDGAWADFALSLSLYVVVGVPCAGFVTVLYGLPIYVLLHRLQAATLKALVLCGAVGGVIVQAAFIGIRAADWFSPLLFAAFGMWAAAAFWYGAERWRPEDPRTPALG